MGGGPGVGVLSPLRLLAPTPDLHTLTVGTAVEAQPQADLAARVPGQRHDADVASREVVVQVVANHRRLIDVTEEGLRGVGKSSNLVPTLSFPSRGGFQTLPIFTGARTGVLSTSPAPRIVQGLVSYCSFKAKSNATTFRKLSEVLPQGVLNLIMGEKQSELD